MSEPNPHGQSRDVAPPSPYPEKGQGPWCTEDLDCWWVVADDAADALKAVLDCEAGYGALHPKFTVERTFIGWAEDYNEDEVCIDERSFDDDSGVVEAWKVTVDDDR